MNKFFLIALFFIFLAPFLSSRHSTAPLWKDKQVTVEPLMTIGVESFDDERYAFGNIRDLTVSKAGNLIVVDNKTFRILKYSNEGQYICQIGKGKGDGPGEFREPLAVTTDVEERIYVVDHGKFKIMVFSPAGQYLHAFGIEKKMPFSLAVGKDHSIYAAYWRPDRAGNYVYRYNQDGRILARFCQEEDKEMEALTLDCGNPGTLCLSPKGHLVYAFHYPYRFRLFSPDGKTMQNFSRKSDSMLPPAKNKKFNYTYSRGGGREVACMPDGTIVCAGFSDKKTDEDNATYFFDFFSPEGKWLKSVPASTFGVKTIFIFTIDGEGHFFIMNIDPYFHIKKFRIRFS